LIFLGCIIPEHPASSGFFDFLVWFATPLGFQGRPYILKLVSLFFYFYYSCPFCFFGSCSTCAVPHLKFSIFLLIKEEKETQRDTALDKGSEQVKKPEQKNNVKQKRETFKQRAIKREVAKRSQKKKLQTLNIPENTVKKRQEN